MNTRIMAITAACLVIICPGVSRRVAASQLEVANSVGQSGMATLDRFAVPLPAVIEPGVVDEPLQPFLRHAVERQIVAESSRNVSATKKERTRTNPRPKKKWAWFSVALGTGLGAALMIDGLTHACSTDAQPSTTQGKCWWKVSLAFTDVTAGLMSLNWLTSKAGGPVIPSPCGAEFRPGDTNFSDTQVAAEMLEYIQSGHHTDLSRAKILGRNCGMGTTTTVTNNARAVMQVYIAGPVGYVVSLPPGKTRRVRLLPGKYEIGARATIGKLAPFYGSEDFARGMAYEIIIPDNR